MNLISEIYALFNKPKCNHPNISTGKEISYCPDCGELISINWYIIRCKCCNAKRTGLLRNEELYPLARHCSNCGENRYIVEKLKNINYFDIHYAVVKKEVNNYSLRDKSFIQVWVDAINKDESIQKLIPKLAE